MKKLILGLFLATAIATTAFTTLHPVAATGDCKYGQCSYFIQKTGKQCKNCAQKGSNYCWSHNHQ